MTDDSLQNQNKLSKIRTYLAREFLWLLWVLIAAYLLSLLAPFHFLPDLFSHFTIQYAIGGLLLGAILYVPSYKHWALVAFCIGLLNVYESRLNLHKPFEFVAGTTNNAAYTIAAYNHNHGRNDFADIQAWLTESDYDVVILQEAQTATVEMAQRLAKIYPYQIHEPRTHAFGMVVLSRYPFLKSEKIMLDGALFASFAVMLVIKTETAAQPLTIYALHPPPPTSGRAQHQRDFELLTIGEKAAQTDGAAVMIGDFNITPFAPAFKELLTVSGLHYQSYDVLQNPTWPSFHLAPFLKIPIDHVLYSDTLILNHKTIGPAFGSDHHPVIATFAEKD